MAPQLRLMEARLRLMEARLRLTEARLRLMEAQSNLTEPQLRLIGGQLRLTKPQLNLAEPQLRLTEPQSNPMELQLRPMKAQFNLMDAQSHLTPRTCLPEQWQVRWASPAASICSGNRDLSSDYLTGFAAKRRPRFHHQAARMATRIATATRRPESGVRNLSAKRSRNPGDSASPSRASMAT